MLDEEDRLFVWFREGDESGVVKHARQAKSRKDGLAATQRVEGCDGILRDDMNTGSSSGSFSGWDEDDSFASSVW